MTTDHTIPVIDLNDFTSSDPVRRKGFTLAVGTALRDVGFFALTNHGLSDDEIKQAYRASEEFFLLDEQQKSNYEDSKIKGQRGFISFGKEHAKDSSAPDLKEFLHIGQESTNQDYPANVWPSEVSSFRPVMVSLYQSLEKAAFSVLEACSEFIGESPNLVKDMAVDGNTILRLIHYPPIPDDAHPASIRAAAHEDINLITLLIDASMPGLEILDKEGNWLPVVTPKNSIIVDSGDMLQNLSNGYLKATTHRVTNPSDSRSRRFSMPFFVHARSEVDLSPLPKSIELSGGTPKYPNITAGEYLHQRLKEIGLA